MTLIAHVGDTHIVERSGDAAAPLSDQIEMLQQIGISASKAGAELLVHGGDVFDRTSTPAERMAAVEVFTYWASMFPVVVVRGNHDRPLDLAFLSRLSTIHPIYVFEQPDVISVGGVTVACLPWPRKAFLAAALDTTSGLELGEASAAGLRAILQGLQAQLSMSEQPTVLLGHVELGGSKLDNGQPVAGNCDVALHEGDLLDVGADVVCLSHIHLHQVIGGGRIVYAGAPRPTRFGEEADKGWCLIDVTKGQPPLVQHRKSQYRPLVTIRMQWDKEAAALVSTKPSQSVAPGSAVRITYDVDDSIRGAAAENAREIQDSWMSEGAHSVRVEAKVSTVHRVRSEAITKARTTKDRVWAYWETLGNTPMRADHILEKMQELESAQ